MAVPLPGELSGIARSSLALMGALVVVAAALVGITSVLPKPRSLAAPATLDPYSQRWVCPLLTNQKTSIAIANTGSAAATLRTTTRIGGGNPALTAKAVPGQLAAGQTNTLTAATTNKPGMVQVESYNAPVVVSAAGEPACMPGPTDHAWLPIADLAGSSDWQPGPAMLLLANLTALPIVDGGATHVRLRFTPLGAGGDWRIDDVYVDPWKGR